MSISKEAYEAIRAAGGDPTDRVWDWLMNRGPHGMGFTWSQTKRQPSGYVGIEHLQKIVEELEPAFRDRLRRSLAVALRTTASELLRRAVQVGATIGREADLLRIVELTDCNNPAVAADARASAFYLRRRLVAE